MTRYDPERQRLEEERELREEAVPPLYEHQRACLEASQDRRAFAILLEQGLGKTRIALDTARYLWRAGKVDGLLIVAPNGIHSNWVRYEIPKHAPGLAVVEWGRPRATTLRWADVWWRLLTGRGLVAFAVNVEALSGDPRRLDGAVKHCEGFLTARRVLMVVDESSRIKTLGSRRTKAVLNLGRLAPYRRIMTGTPVTQSPFDLYSQFRFLDPAILGFSSYHAFRHQYGVFQKRIAGARTGGHEYEELVEYVRLDDLARRIVGHSYRRTKAECLDLPAKVYQRIPVELSAEQRRIYDGLMDEGLASFEDFDVLAPLQITRLLRCQQVLGGFLPVNGEFLTNPTQLPESAVSLAENPRLDRLIELLEEDYPGKAIIWARFRAEIRAIVAALLKRFPNGVVELHGGVTPEARIAGVRAFQEDSAVRFLVGQQASGLGVTLTAAEHVFYYSNSFSYEQRYQSEDRAHRIGQRKTVVYVDFVAKDTVDERILDVLLNAERRAIRMLDERRGWRELNGRESNGT